VPFLETVSEQEESSGDDSPELSVWGMLSKIAFPGFSLSGNF